MISSAVFVAELSSTLCQVVTQCSTAFPAASVEFAKTIPSGRGAAAFGGAQFSPSMAIAETMWMLSSGNTTQWASWVMTCESSSMSSAMWSGSSHSMLVTASCLAASCSWSS